MSVKEIKNGSMLPNDYFYIKIVKDLGILPGSLGYCYLIEMLDMVMNEKIKIKSFSKQVYPVLAKKYNKNEFTIERNVRSLIDKKWDILKIKLDEFWNKEKRPSCCKFVYVLKNYILFNLV